MTYPKSSLNNQRRRIKVAFQGGEIWHFCYRVVTLKTEFNEIEAGKQLNPFKFKLLKLADSPRAPPLTTLDFTVRHGNQTAGHGRNRRAGNAVQLSGRRTDAARQEPTTRRRARFFHKKQGQNGFVPAHNRID